MSQQDENIKLQHERDGFAWSLIYPDKKDCLSSYYKQKATLIYRFSSQKDKAYKKLFLPKALAKACEKELNTQAPHSYSELINLLEPLAQKTAQSSLIRTLNKTDITCYQAQEKLKRAGYADTTIQSVVAYMQQAKLIDDDRFCDIFIRSKLAAGWGEIKILQELKRRGIQLCAIDEKYFEEEETEEQRAYALLQHRSVPSKNPYQKLVHFLLRKGYHLAPAKQATSRYLNDMASDTDI